MKTSSRDFIDRREQMEILRLIQPVKQNFGNWLYNADNKTLTHTKAWYEIDLERVTSADDMIDWIFQVSPKLWVTRKDLADLIYAFDYLFDPQSQIYGRKLQEVKQSEIEIRK